MTAARPAARGNQARLAAPSFIIAAPLAGRAPQVRVFDDRAKQLHAFYAFPQSFRAGVNIAAGDLDGDGEIEIIAAARKGASPQVHVYALSGTRKSSFLAYHPGFAGGVNVAVGDLDGDGVQEIITAPTADGEVYLQLFAFAPSFRGGVTVAAADINKDGREEVIVGAGPGGAPQIAVYNSEGVVLSRFGAFEAGFRQGMNVASGN